MRWYRTSLNDTEEEQQSKLLILCNCALMPVLSTQNTAKFIAKTTDVHVEQYRTKLTVGTGNSRKSRSGQGRSSGEVHTVYAH